MDSGWDSSALRPRVRARTGSALGRLAAVGLLVALAVPALAVALPAAANGDDSSDPAATPYDDIRREIERAGRAGKVKALRKQLDRIDRVLEEPSPTEVTACWQLMKSTVLVELARADDARTLLGLLVDTCPIWEARNNLGVLEAGAGRFSAAVQNLRLAAAEARKAGLDEEAVPQGNLRELLSQVERPSLILAGYVRECAETLSPRADCHAPEPPPPAASTADTQDPPPPPTKPPPEAPVDIDAGGVPPPTELLPPEIDQPAVESEELDAGRPDTVPEPAGEESSDEAAVRQAIERWRLAWQEQRFDDYVAAYGPEFPPSSELSRAQWLECRRDRIVNKRSISLEIGEIEVLERGGGDLLAIFPLSYDSDTYSDQTDKELVLRKLDEGWKIIDENLDGQNCP